MPDLNEIEARLEGDRQALATSLDLLSDAVAPTAVADQMSEVARDYGGEIGRQAWEAARANPAAFALVGAGLGLLISGTGSRPNPPSDPKPQNTVPPQKAMTGFDERVAQADKELKKEMTGMLNAESRAKQMRTTLENGLDHLPDAARKRVLKARKAALAAQERVERGARQAAAKSRTFHHEQPLAVGAIALGIGALIGAFLPSTRQEDALMGAERDALMTKAKEVLDDEMSRLATATQSKIDDVARAGGDPL